MRDWKIVILAIYSVAAISYPTAINNVLNATKSFTDFNNCMTSGNNHCIEENEDKTAFNPEGYCC